MKRIVARQIVEDTSKAIVAQGLLGDKLRAIAKQRRSDLIRLSVSYTKYEDGTETFRAVVTDERFGVEEIATTRDPDCARAIDYAVGIAGNG
jgi:hypothetical protein